MGFLFICSNDTQAECFERNLFGDTEMRADQVRRIKKGDFPGFLYNVDSRKLFGVFEAISDGASNIVSEACEGRYPWQVRVKLKKEYRPLDKITLETIGLGDVVFERLLTDEQSDRILKLFEAQIPSAGEDETQQWIGKRFLELMSGNIDWREFESRVNDVFASLGFETTLLGHEALGPLPDIVLYPPPSISRVGFDFWIVVDCKKADEYYITEDDHRAMRSYLEDHRKEVIQRGLDPKKCYFIFVALGFKDMCTEKIKEIQKKTMADGGLLKVENLLLLMLKNLKTGGLNLAKFPDLIRGEEITREKIEATFQE